MLLYLFNYLFHLTINVLILLNLYLILDINLLLTLQFNFLSKNLNFLLLIIDLLPIINLLVLFLLNICRIILETTFDSYKINNLPIFILLYGLFFFLLH